MGKFSLCSFLTKLASDIQYDYWFDLLFNNSLKVFAKYISSMGHFYCKREIPVNGHFVDI